MSVVRATTATRVNSAGLVELVPYNLFTYSEDLTQWTANGDIATTQLVLNPLTGQNNATKITSVSSPSDPWVAKISSAGNGTYTYSVYLWTDSGQPLDVVLFLYNNAVSEVFTFPITLTTTPTRYQYTSTFVNTGGSLVARIDLSTPATQYIYAYAAQLVEGSTAKDYQKTETRLNIPRLDYSNGTCPSLLVEPQRTNLLTYSSSFDNSDWGKIGITAFANNTTAPNGTMSADKIAFTNTNSYIYPTAVVSAITNNSFSYSVYAKADTQSAFNMLIGTPVGVWGANFDLTTQTATPFSGSGTSGKIESVDNGWFRCILTAPIPVVVYAEASIGFPIAGGSLFFWGAQIEAGAYPTSYIPTTSASVTRNADVISKTGISSLIGQTEGTIFFDGYFGNNSDEVYLFLQSTGSTSIDNSIYLVKVGVGISLKVFVGSTSQVSIQGGSFTLGQRIKIAAAYKQNDFILYVNGTQIGTDVLGNVPTCSNLHLGTYAGDPTNQIYIANKGINSAILFPTRLTNTQLAQLTTI
jgi:hypothetical protein